MYKLLLCWRYLRTRYIALASIISVTLGVATMIVVNAVMSGFSNEMENRIRGVLSDMVLESHDILEGLPDPQRHMDEIRKVAGDDIVGMTPTVHVPAILSFKVRDQFTTRQIMLIGIDEATYASVSDFSMYLQHPENREQLTFDLHEEGYDVRDHQVGEQAPLRPAMEKAGWKWRRLRTQMNAMREQSQASRASFYDNAEAPQTASSAHATDETPKEGEPSPPSTTANPFDAVARPEVEQFDPMREQHTGIIMGIAMPSVRDHTGTDRFLILPGDDVIVTAPTAGTPPKPAHDSFTVVDFYESKMSEYDSTFAFVPIKSLQAMRAMGNNVTAIQIKLKPGVSPDAVRDRLRSHFRPELYGVYTWRDKQGPLLAAVQMEKAVLNILLFLIIAVAGFGILAIFFMIVVEKTRDVGILKSLGASSQGIMGIFLSYGLSLGIVGAGAGMGAGLLFVKYINEIRAGLEWLTGQPVFDPAIYYFYEIPTIVDPFTVTWIVIGALSIAVLASVLPALRAARLHPVEALRYE